MVHSVSLDRGESAGRIHLGDICELSQRNLNNLRARLGQYRQTAIEGLRDGFIQPIEHNRLRDGQTHSRERTATHGQHCTREHGIDSDAILNTSGHRADGV